MIKIGLYKMVSRDLVSFLRRLRLVLAHLRFLEVFNGLGVFGYLTVSNWLKVSVPQNT